MQSCMSLCECLQSMDIEKGLLVNISKSIVALGTLSRTQTWEFWHLTARDKVNP